MKSKEIIKFLKSHPLISMRGLEKVCKITPSTLSKCVNRGDKINDKYIKSLEKVLSKYGY